MESDLEKSTAIENENPMLDINEKKVNIAVRFLCNFNVRDTPRDRKIKFLEDKGLNQEEITLALEKADEHRENFKESEKEEWTFWDYFKGIVLSAGILSSANYAYKAYVLPYVAHEIKDDQRIELLKDSVQILKDDLKQKSYEFTCTLKSIQSLLEEQKKLLSNIDKELNKEPNATAPSLNNIKTDIETLKALMLNKNNFASAPIRTTPTIPAWQKAADVKDSAAKKEDEVKASEEKEKVENQEDLNSD